MAKSGRTIKWIETIRSPTTQEWSSESFSLLERADAIGMFDVHVRESRESVAVSGIGYPREQKFVKTYQSGMRYQIFLASATFFLDQS